MGQRFESLLKISKSLQQQQKIKKTAAAFTLVELLLSISIMLMLVVVSAPVYQSFQFANELDNAVTLTVSSIRTAQNFAITGKDDASWGVNIGSQNITIFRGDSFSARDASFDTTTILSSNISTAGLSTVIFGKNNGLPNTTGTINLQNNAGNLKTININAKGRLNY